MDIEKAVKTFPSYFSNFSMPEWAREQSLTVFRACATGTVDRLSFLNTFEENNFQINVGEDPSDPSQYSLSTYTKFRDVKRFMTMDSKFGIPYVIAEGITSPEHGICLETKEWKRHLGIQSKTSHVDWWLYENATPWQEFKVIKNEY